MPMSAAEVLREAERIRRSLAPEERERIKRCVEEAEREVGRAVLRVARAIEASDPDTVQKMMAKMLGEARHHGR